jgi:hypothetical protein
MSEGFPSLKTQAVLQFLVPISLGYLAAAVFLSKGTVPTTGQLWDHATVAAIMAVAGTLFQDLIPKPFKEFLVFYRLRNRLPAHRCFTDQMLNNSRVSRDKIQDLAELVALEPADQNKAWYKMYKPLSSQPAIKHYSYRYVAWRDSATLLFGFSIATVTIWYMFPRTMTDATAAILGTGCLILYLAAATAARLSSRELVLMVLIEMEK